MAYKSDPHGASRLDDWTLRVVTPHARIQVLGLADTPFSVPKLDGFPLQRGLLTLASCSAESVD